MKQVVAQNPHPRLKGKDGPQQKAKEEKQLLKEVALNAEAIISLETALTKRAKGKARVRVRDTGHTHIPAKIGDNGTRAPAQQLGIHGFQGHETRDQAKVAKEDWQVV